MNTNTIPVNRLNTASDSLTYGELRSLLPHVSEKRLPSLKFVLSGGYNDSVLFSDKVADATLTLYSHGFYLYEERTGGTVYSTFMAGSLMNANYASLTAAPALDCESLVNLPWFWPLTIAGKVRLERNLDKRRSKAEKRYLEEQRNLRIDSVTPDFVSESIAIADERLLRARLEAALNALTERERQVITLYIRENQKRSQVAWELRVCPATVSNTKRRGIGKLRADMLRKETP